MKRILVFFGGCSSEHGVSLQSAHAVLTHMDRSRYSPVPVGITREGRWLYYTGDLDAIPDGRWQDGPCIPCTLCLEEKTARTAPFRDCWSWPECL